MPSSADRPTLTFWFEFASTYSYLTAMRLAPLAEDAGVEVVWQPFLLGPIFQAQGWETSPFNLFEAKGRNMWRDMARQVDKMGLPPLTRPEPFPQNGLLAARVATLGQGAAWLPGFVRAVYTAQFAQGRDISNPATIVRCLADLGQKAEPLIAQAGSDPQIKERLKTATAQASALGLFGAPSFTTKDGELFWGNDRLEDALAWAARTGRS